MVNGMPLGFEPAQPTKLSRSSIEEIAEAVSDQIGYEPEIPLSKLVAQFGGSLRVRDYFESDVTDSIQIRKLGDFEIFLANHASALSNRFTVAHELGHYVLHYLWHVKDGKAVPPTCASRYGTDPADWEANWFAAAFLMPKAAVQAVFSESASVVRVAAHFAVSTRAASNRLRRLRLLDRSDGNHDASLEVSAA